MPSISGSYNPNVGAIVQVAIMPLEQVQNSDGTPKHPGDGSNIKFFNALIDTGASCTCVSSNAAKQAKLKVIGKAPMAGATGVNHQNKYAFAVGFMINARQDASGKINSDLSVQVVNGMEFDNQSGGFDVLLGRDIICRGVLNMSYDGHYSLSF